MTGVAARRIRFYSDKGLLPPYSRTEAGYRVFGDEDVARLELITALRETEASLSVISSVLSKKATLADVLAAQLREVEHRITAQRRIASAMRSALQSSKPTVRDLKRVATMLDIAHSERREVAKAFFDKVTEGLDLEPNWKPRMIEIGSPELPDEPTGEQVEAWIALAKLFDNAEFFTAMRAVAEDDAHSPPRYITDTLDPYVMSLLDILKRARATMERGVEPTSSEAASLAEEQIKLLAERHGVSADEEFREQMRRRHQRSRITRPFYELSNTLRAMPKPDINEQDWLQRAVRSRLGMQ